jgi:hypothetical protein
VCECVCVVFHPLSRAGHKITRVSHAASQAKIENAASMTRQPVMSSMWVEGEGWGGGVEHMLTTRPAELSRVQAGANRGYTPVEMPGTDSIHRPRISRNAVQSKSGVSAAFAASPSKYATSVLGESVFSYSSSR